MTRRKKGPIQLWADEALHRTEFSQDRALKLFPAVRAALPAEDADSLYDSWLHYATVNGNHYADAFREEIRAAKAKAGER